MGFRKIAIIGCGLIGGSLAKKIHQEKPSVHLVAVSSRAEDLRQEPESDCFSTFVTEISQLDTDCDLVFVCVPIDHTVSTIIAVSKQVKDSCLITDVASVKEKIETEINTEVIKQPVILGHPMAGKERTGFGVSESSLFDAAPYFLIRDESTAYQELKTFLSELGLRIIETTTKEHDTVVSLSSHLPYILASACIGAVGEQSSEIQALVKQSYGPGFRDSTRVAGSDPQWGKSVCQDNTKNLINHIEAVVQQLTQFKKKLTSNNFRDLEAILTKHNHTKTQLNR